MFTIKYLNDKEGKFIIGGYPHEYNNQYKEIILNLLKQKFKEIIFLLGN